MFQAQLPLCVYNIYNSRMDKLGMVIFPKLRKWFAVRYQTFFLQKYQDNNFQKKKKTTF